MESPGLWALSQVGLTRSEKHVLTVLAVRANSSTWSCYPGVKTLEGDTGLKRKAIMGATQSLEAKGLIHIQRRRRKSNVYTLNPRYQEVPAKGTSKPIQEVPKSNQEVPFQAL